MRTTRTVRVTQQYLRVVINATPLNEGSQFGAELLDQNANNKIRKV